MLKTWLSLANSQALQQIIALARIKSAALIIGSAGVGLSGIITSTMTTFQQFSSFGLHQSAIRSISGESNKPYSERYSYSAFRKLAFISSILGFFLCFLMSSWLSKIVFNSKDYQLSFALLSISILFTGFGNIYTTLMQSEGRVDLFTKTSLISAFLTLIASIPILIYMRIDGVVPVIIIGSFLFLSVSYYYSNNTCKNKYAHCSWRELYKHGKPMLKLGFVLMISNTIMALMAFLLNATIARIGNLEDVGLYLSALNIVAVNLAIVNASVSTDFFPRITVAITNKVNVSKIINNQIGIAVNAIIPTSVLLIALSPIIIKIILSEEFNSATPILQIMACALLFRAVWNILAYYILATGDKWVYFFYDTVVCNGFNFVINLTLYKTLGLEGLGFSYFIGSIFGAAILLVVAKRNYQCKFEKVKALDLIFIALPLMTILMNSFIIEGVLKNVIIFSLILITITMSFLRFKKIIREE